jgi:chromosome segregation ATPase
MGCKLETLRNELPKLESKLPKLENKLEKLTDKPKKLTDKPEKATGAPYEMDANQAKILKQIYGLLNQLGDEAKSHLVTNLYKVADVLTGEDEHMYMDINAKYEKLTGTATSSIEDDVMAVVKSMDSEKAEDVLSELSVKSVYSRADKDDLYWDAIALLDMMDPMYTYISTGVDGEAIRHVFRKSDMPKVIEALKKA